MNCDLVYFTTTQVRDMNDTSATRVRQEWYEATRVLQECYMNNTSATRVKKFDFDNRQDELNHIFTPLY